MFTRSLLGTITVFLALAACPSSASELTEAESLSFARLCSSFLPTTEIPEETTSFFSNMFLPQIQYQGFKYWDSKVVEINSSGA